MKRVRGRKVRMNFTETDSVYRIILYGNPCSVMEWWYADNYYTLWELWSKMNTTVLLAKLLHINIHRERRKQDSTTQKTKWKISLPRHTWHLGARLRIQPLSTPALWGCHWRRKPLCWDQVLENYKKQQRIVSSLTHTVCFTHTFQGSIKKVFFLPTLQHQSCKP